MFLFLVFLLSLLFVFFFFQAEDGIRDFCLSRGLGDVYKRQIQCVSSARVCVASVVAHTDASPRTEPTDRSIPPPVITNVMPMLSTPITAASRRIVMTLSTLANRSPAVLTPTTHSTAKAMTSPMLRPAPPLISRRSRLGTTSPVGATISTLCSVTRRSLP